MLMVHGNPTESGKDAVENQDHESMYFYASTKSTLLFKSWEIDTDYEFWIAMGGIVTLGLLYEMVKSFRSCLIVEANNSALNAENKPILGERDGRSCLEQLCVQSILTLFYIIETLFMFFSMLIFMSYNVFFCTALIVGIGVGYFAFGGTRDHTYGLGRDNLDNDGLRGRLA